MKTLKILLTLAVFSSVCFAQSSIELINACKKGDLQAVKTLIRSGADINSRDENSVTALMLAAKNGHLEVVKELLKYGAEVHYSAYSDEYYDEYYYGYYPYDFRNDYYSYKEPFCYAIDGGNIEILKLILKKIEEKNEHPNLKKRYLAALNNAIRYSMVINKIEICKFLLNSGVDIYYSFPYYSYKSEDGKSHNSLNPIRLAAITRNLEILKEMVKLMGKDGKPRKLYDALIYACRVKNNVDIVKYLIQEGSLVNGKEKEGRLYIHSIHGYGYSAPLANTISIEDMAMMKELIRAKADINSVFNGGTPLMWAIYINNSEIVKELIKSGASVKAEQYNNRLLIWSIHAEINIGIIEELIKAGVDVNFKDSDGKTALMSAVEVKRFDIVELLEKYGAK